MSSPEGVITRLIARVRALFAEEWRGPSGQHILETITTISDFTDEHHLRPKDVLGEGVELGRRKLEGLANHEFSQATKNFADAEKTKIENELQRRVLESDVARKEAKSRKAGAEARIEEIKALEAEMEFMEKLQRAGVLLHKDPAGNLTILPAPVNLSYLALRQRVLETRSQSESVAHGTDNYGNLERASTATLSPFDPAAEARRLAALFNDFSMSVDEYWLGLPAYTPKEQLVSLKVQAQTLQTQSHQFTAEAIGATLAAIQNDLAHLKQVIAQARDQLGVLNSLAKAIAVASSATELGVAIAIGSPGGILAATEALARQVTG